MRSLAVLGGKPVRQKAFPLWPIYGEKEKEALHRILESGTWGTLGPEVEWFAKRYAAYQNSPFGIAVANGTVSLEIILRGLGIGYGDAVILPPYTFYATASAIIAVGATPVFCDIQPDTYNLDPEKLSEAITSAVKAVIVVHVGGRPCEMDRVFQIAAASNIHVIELVNS